MGDRTTMYLTVPKVLSEETAKLFKHDEDDNTEYDEYMDYTFDECNYATLPFTDLLIKHGIPHNQQWEKGDNYGSGNRYIRFTSEGLVVVKEIYDEALSISLEDVMELIDDPVALKTHILRLHKANKILGWDNQIEYGRIYRARVLITG